MATPLTTTGVGTAAQNTASVRPVGGTVSLVDSGGADVTYVPTAAGGYYVNFRGDGFVFYPRSGFSGTAPSVTYKITDDDFQSATSTYTATVTKPAPPTASPLSSTRSEGAGYQYADTSGIPGNIASASLVSGGMEGPSLRVEGAGTYYANAGDGVTIAFDADSCFVGTVPTVTYRLTDQYDQHADSTYTAHVTNPSPPTVSPLTSTGSGPARQTVTAPQPACVGSTKLLKGGQPVTTLTNADGTYTVDPATGVITFAPAPGVSGDSAPVGYRVTDAFGQQADSTYTSNVEPPPPPTALPLTSTGDGPAAQQVTAVVPAGGRASLLDGTTPVTSLTVDGEGRYTVNATSGVITFTPQASYLGTATPVSYRVTDSYDHSSTSTYTATVTEPAAPNPSALTSTGAGPAVQSRTASIPPGGSVTLLDGPTPVTTLTVAGQGTYALDAATGVIRFTPVNGYTGTATSATYQVTDSYGQTGSSTYTPTVTTPAPPAAAPLKSTGAAGSPQQQTVTVPPGGTVTLLDGTAAVTTVTNPGQGTYALDPATGVITFTPLAGYSGHPTPVDYQVSDAYGQSVRSTYTPTVIAAVVTTSPTTPAPTPTTPTVAPTATATTASAPSEPAATGALPNTGSDVAELTQIALLLLVIGLALSAAGRFRRRPARPRRHD